MTAHNRRLKLIELDVGSGQVECQVTAWTMTPPQDDGEKVRTFCPDGEFIEEVDPDWMLEVTFLADWRAGGLSDYLMENAGTDAAFVLDHHPDIPAEHVRWSGTLRLKAPPVGGERSTTESQTVTMQCIGEPTYVRV